MKRTIDKKYLFTDRMGHKLYKEDIIETLIDIETNDCNYLFIHSAMSFGLPNKDLSRNEIAKEILEAILATNIPNIIFPTFTFSFCNNEDYDIQNTKTKMGFINEYTRKDYRFKRTSDPLLSVTILGDDNQIINIGKYSIGKDSFYDKLAKRDKVKFLFFGTNLGDCFTYMHYLEWVNRVPYRYDRTFTGTIIDRDRNYQDQYTLFVRYNGVIPSDGSYCYEQLLKNYSMLKSRVFGDSSISCVDRDMATDVYNDIIKKNMYYFVDGNIYSKDESFTSVNMVSL